MSNYFLRPDNSFLFVSEPLSFFLCRIFLVPVIQKLYSEEGDRSLGKEPKLGSPPSTQMFSLLFVRLGEITVILKSIFIFFVT